MPTHDNVKKIASVNFNFAGYGITIMFGLLLFSVGTIHSMNIRAKQVAAIETIGREQAMIEAEQDAYMKTIAHVTVFIGMVALIAATVFGSVLSSQIYRQIHDDIDLTTSGKAFASCFLPLIVCTGFFSSDVFFLRYERVIMGLSLAFGFSIAAIFFFKSVKDNAVRLWESEQ
jgi:hypothetical protein